MDSLNALKRDVQKMLGGFVMRKTGTMALILCLLLSLSSPAALSEQDYVGEWVGVAIDIGDGVKLTEYEGTSVSDLMRLEFKEDGTLVVTSFGQQIPGTWTAVDDGISATVEDESVLFKLMDGQLVNDSDGSLIYLEKAAQTPKAGKGLLGTLKRNKYTGSWVATGIDPGDGNIVTQMDGVDIAGMITILINRDGTLTLSSVGTDMEGSWKEIDGGIAITVDEDTTDVLYKDGKLAASEDGQTVYFERAGSAVAQATPTPAPTAALVASGFEGDWTAYKYEMGDYWYDAKLIFPEGCVLSLQPNGTGSAKITADYTETFTWKEQDGLPVISGSYVFSDPKWDADKNELRLQYGTTSDIQIVFSRDPEAKVEGEFGPIDAEATPEVLEEPEATAEAEVIEEPEATAEAEVTGELDATAEAEVMAEAEVTEEPSEEPETTEEPVTTIEPEVTSGPEAAEQKESATESAFTSPLFSVSFPEGWVSDDYTLSSGDSYSAVKYWKDDGDGGTLSSLTVYVSSEGVDSYRRKLKQLKEYTAKSGGVLEETTIGKVDFMGAEYENWGWNYREYAARVAESGITINIVEERPENAEEALQEILDSITFTLPQLSPPNVDPPLPEDGVPYEPTPKSVSVGKYTLQAEWVTHSGSIILDSIFGNRIAYVNKKLYVLAGKSLYAYSVKNDKLTPGKEFDGGVMTLGDTFEFLSAAKDGTLYASQGFYNTLALKDGKLLKDNPIAGDVVMHPDGKWGISAWANADTKKVTASKGSLTEEPWVLTGLSDEAQRKGRFSMISYVYISDKRIYVAGSDAENGDAQRIAVFDLEGKELFSFGAADWMQDDALGSVTGIVETKNGILVQDGNYHAYKLFTKDGDFIGKVDCDELLGTSYPWLSSMVPADGGVYVAASQRRADESCDELLLFKISGF